jgi:DNA-binding NarL/FixJ family response regulator
VTGEGRVRVLVADDHHEFRSSVRLLLKGVPEVEIVAECATGAGAVVIAGAKQPDVVLMDLKMPDLNGIDATRAIVAENPRIAVLVLSMFDDDESVFRAVRVGARGYVLKGVGRDELVRAILAVAAGDAIFGPAVAARILAFFAGRESSSGVFPQLTEREGEVLDRIAAGHNNGRIANDLFLSPKTVRNHVSSIFSKLQVADRSEAIVRARDAGLGRG